MDSSAAERRQHQRILLKIFTATYASTAEVIGSTPVPCNTYADLAHLVERHLAKVEVASSSLVIRFFL